MRNVFFLWMCNAVLWYFVVWAFIFFLKKACIAALKLIVVWFFSHQINFQLRPKISCFLSIFVYRRPSKCYCFGFAVLALIFSWCTILRWWSLSFGRTVFLRSFKIFWPDSILKEYVVIPHLSSLSMTLGLALITIVIYDGVVEDDGRDDDLQLAKETYDISYIASKVMPLENLARYKVLTVFSNTSTQRSVY